MILYFCVSSKSKLHCIFSLSLFFYNRGQYTFFLKPHTVGARSLPLSCPEAFPRCPEVVRMCSISLCNQRQGGHLIPQHLLPLHRLTPVSMSLREAGYHTLAQLSGPGFTWPSDWTWSPSWPDRKAAGHLIRRPNKPRWSFSGDPHSLRMLGCCHLYRPN